MTNLQKSIEATFFNFAYHSNAPLSCILDIIKETEKAIQVTNSENNKTIWIPKKALDYDENKMVWTVKKWFKNKIYIDNYKLIALGV